MEVVSREDLSRMIAANENITAKEARERIDSVINAISEYMMNGYTIQLGGFGTFYFWLQPPRAAQNPRKGCLMDIPAKVKPKFRFSPKIANKVMYDENLIRKLQGE